MTDLIHIHEDDWGMRSLYPAAAWAEASGDLDAAIAAGQLNRAPDGIGWINVHVIKAPSLDFTSTGLLLDVIASRLAGIMPRVARFYATATAGYDPSTHDSLGSYEVDAWCFGSDATCFVKLEPSGPLVRRIWFEAKTTEPEKLGALRAALLAIDGTAEAMIIDYWSDTAGLVRDAAFMDQYFTALARDGVAVATPGLQ